MRRTQAEQNSDIFHKVVKSPPDIISILGPKRFLVWFGPPNLQMQMHFLLMDIDGYAIETTKMPPPLKSRISVSLSSAKTKRTKL